MNDSFRLALRIWGVRGSLPTPRIENLGYGGHTPCLEVRTQQDEILIFDAGTGIHPFGTALVDDLEEESVSMKLFLSYLEEGAKLNHHYGF